MVKIIKDLGLFRHTEEYVYNPTPAELFYYYQGTNAGLNRDNPYAPKYGMTVTKRRHIKVSNG